MPERAVTKAAGEARTMKGRTVVNCVLKRKVQELSGLIEEARARARARAPHTCIFRFLFPLFFREYPVVSVHIRLLRTHDELYERA